MDERKEKASIIMEERVLTEKESLELIASMIQDTQNRMARYAAYPSLIWGYMTALISIVVWFVLGQYQMPEIHYLWFLLPLVCFPLTLYFSRKDRLSGVKNYMDRIMAQLWWVLGIVVFLLSCFAFMGKVDILFLVSLLVGIGVTLSGCVSKYSPMRWAGTVGIALSFSLLFVNGLDGLLVFALLFIVMTVIPGHLLNRKMKQACSRS